MKMSMMKMIMKMMMTVIMMEVMMMVVMVEMMMMVVMVIIIVIFFFLSSCTPLTGPRLTLRSVSPSICLEEVIESATLNPLCYPNSYLSDLQPEAAVPDFH